MIPAPLYFLPMGLLLFFFGSAWLFYEEKLRQPRELTPRIFVAFGSFMLFAFFSTR